MFENPFANSGEDEEFSPPPFFFRDMINLIGALFPFFSFSPSSPCLSLGGKSREWQKNFGHRACGSLESYSNAELPLSPLFLRSGREKACRIAVSFFFFFFFPLSATKRAGKTLPLPRELLHLGSA